MGGFPDTQANTVHFCRFPVSKRQSLIDTAMDSISLIQLKLRAGRKLTSNRNPEYQRQQQYIQLMRYIITTASDLNDNACLYGYSQLI